MSGVDDPAAVRALERGEAVTLGYDHPGEVTVVVQT